MLDEVIVTAERGEIDVKVDDAEIKTAEVETIKNSNLGGDKDDFISLVADNILFNMDGNVEQIFTIIKDNPTRFQNLKSIGNSLTENLRFGY